VRVVGTKSVAGDLLHTALGARGENPPNLTAALLADGALKRVGEVQVGEYTGTGAALDVALEFDPIFVAVFNLTDGTMAGFALNTANVAGKSYRQTGAAGFVAAVTGILFAAAGTRKFSLGVDAIVNVNLKVYQFVAFGA
jgi:hypothetical protein